MTVAHTSRMTIHKHAGPHRTAKLEGFEGTIPFGIHGGIKDFYQEKYGREIPGPEYPATLDHMIAGVAGWLVGTLGSALDVRQISSAENLFAKVEGDIGDVDGVLQITAIRVTYFLKAPPGSEEAVARILASYADFCPAYQSVRNCIEISWEMELIEE